MIVNLENDSDGSNSDDESESEDQSVNEEYNFDCTKDSGEEVDDGTVAVGGLRRSARKNKGRTTRYQDYALLHTSRTIAEREPSRATVKDGVVMFSRGDIMT
jgi:hypothetical protein